VSSSARSFSHHPAFVVANTHGGVVVDRRRRPPSSSALFFRPAATTGPPRYPSSAAAAIASARGGGIAPTTATSSSSFSPLRLFGTASAADEGEPTTTATKATTTAIGTTATMDKVKESASAKTAAQKLDAMRRKMEECGVDGEFSIFRRCCFFRFRKLRGAHNLFAVVLMIALIFLQKQ
jgi:hypothetical protein